LKLATPLLHQGRIAVKEEARVVPPRLDGVCLRRRLAVPGPGLSARSELLLALPPGLGFLLLRLQTLLPEPLHSRLELRRGHTAEAQERIHPGHSPGLIGKAPEALGLRSGISRRAGKHAGLLIAVHPPLVRPRRKGRRCRVEVGRRLREVLERVAVERGQIVVETPLNRPTRGLVPPERSSENPFRLLGPALLLIKLRPNARNPSSHFVRVVLPFQRLQAPQGPLRISASPLHLDGRQAGRKLQLIRRAVLVGLSVGGLRLVEVFERFVHLSQKKRPSGFCLIRKAFGIVQSPGEGLLRLLPLFPSDLELSPGQLHPRSPGAIVRFRVQSGTQGLRGLRVPVGRQKGLDQPKPSLSFALPRQCNNLPEFLSGPDVVLLVVSRPPDEEQCVVDPL
jgi:hypothetical protein